MMNIAKFKRKRYCFALNFRNNIKVDIISSAMNLLVLWRMSILTVTVYRCIYLSRMVSFVAVRQSGAHRQLRLYTFCDVFVVRARSDIS